MKSPIFQGKRRSPLDGIRAYCLWCCGGSPSEVNRCPSDECACHPYRLGAIQSGASRSLIKAIKDRCADCMPEGAEECDAYQEYEHHPACPLWPFRLGRNPNYGLAQREERKRRGKKQKNFSAPQTHPGSRIDPRRGSGTSPRMASGKGHLKPDRSVSQGRTRKAKEEVLKKNWS